jgi:hypothetical protein
MTRVEKQIVEYVGELTEEQRLKVLEFVRQLNNQPPQGESGEDLIRRVADIHIPSEDLEEMKRAIEEGCEQIDYDGW